MHFKHLNLSEDEMLQHPFKKCIATNTIFSILDALIRYKLKGKGQSLEPLALILSA